MENNYLFPHRMKIVGLFLFGIGLVFGLYLVLADPELSFLNLTVFAFFDNQMFQDRVLFNFTQNNLKDEIAGILLLVGAVLMAFSRERIEDEFSRAVRLSSLVWATYFNTVLLLLAILFLYGWSFYWVMVVNLFASLLFFVFRFRIMMHKYSNDEE